MQDGWASAEVGYTTPTSKVLEMEYTASVHIEIDRYLAKLSIDSFVPNLSIDSFVPNLLIDSFVSNLSIDSFAPNLSIDSFHETVALVRQPSSLTQSTLCLGNCRS
jgi:hypothetical protein